MTVMDGFKSTIVVMFIAQVYFIVLYVGAKKHKPHSSFTYLLSAAVLSLIYLALTSASYFFEMPQELATDLYRYGLFVAFPGTILGVIGLRSLVHSFAGISKEPPSNPAPSADKWVE